MYTLRRYKTGDDGTFGRLYDEQGAQLCVTVERSKKGAYPCIAPGVYEFYQYNSPTKGDVWLRDDEAAEDGRHMIEIHAANWARELKGCIAPGHTVALIEGELGVTSSKATMRMLKGLLPASFELEIVEAFE